MNKLKPEKQKQIIASLIEGNSIRATCRMTDTAKGTVLKLLADVGKACEEYQNKVLRDLPCKKIQCDEIWSFCYAKEKNVPEEKKVILALAMYGRLPLFVLNLNLFHLGISEEGMGQMLQHL